MPITFVPTIGGPLAGGTTGSVPFVAAGGVFAQNNANLFWDDGNGMLRVFGNAPASGTLSKLGLGSAIASGNTNGTYLGINAQSGFVGNLLDIQVNGSRKARFDNNGSLFLSNLLEVGGTAAITTTFHSVMWNGGGYGWTSAGSSSMAATIETAIYRDAANVIAQRNGANAQAFRVYNTYTGASDYERGFVRWNSNVLEMGVEVAGTGTSRALAFLTANTQRWQVNTSGHLLAGANNTYDIGATGPATAPRAVYVCGSTGIRHQAGTSTLEATMVGVANVNTTAVGNVLTGEDDLITYTLPANALSANSKGVRITAWGTTASNANGKTIKLYFGGTAILTFALVASVAGFWRIEATVLRTGASTQTYSSQLLSVGVAGAAVDSVEVGTAAETDTSAIVIKCTGTATLTDDISQKCLHVEFLN